MPAPKWRRLIGTRWSSSRVDRLGMKTAGTIASSMQITPTQIDRWRVAASAFNLGTVYMAQNGKRDDDFTPYLWKSTDYGDHWKSIVNNLPSGPVNVIREDPVNKDILYAGTDLGVYVTKNGGKKWSVLGGNAPQLFVHDLIIHPRDNILVIATHGRGMYAMDANPVNGGIK